MKVLISHFGIDRTYFVLAQSSDNRLYRLIGLEHDDPVWEPFPGLPVVSGSYPPPQVPQSPKSHLG